MAFFKIADKVGMNDEKEESIYFCSRYYSGIQVLMGQGVGVAAQVMRRVGWI